VGEIEHAQRHAKECGGQIGRAVRVHDKSLIEEEDDRPPAVNVSTLFEPYRPKNLRQSFDYFFIGINPRR
jgi:hypothetical protein